MIRCERCGSLNRMGNGKCIICEGVVGTEEKISQIKDMNVGGFKNNKYSESNQKIKDHTFIGGKDCIERTPYKNRSFTVYLGLVIIVSLSLFAFMDTPVISFLDEAGNVDYSLCINSDSFIRCIYIIFIITAVLIAIARARIQLILFSAISFFFFPFSAAIVGGVVMTYSDEPWIDVVRAEGFYYILIGIIVVCSAVLIDFLIDRQKKREYEKSPI